MSHPTDSFAVPVIFSLRNPALYALNGLLQGNTSFGASPEALAAAAKLSPDERNALRSAITGILDQSIAGFLNTLDEAANTIDGLAITYEKKALTTGDYEFTDLFPEWLKKAAHDKSGAPVDVK